MGLAFAYILFVCSLGAVYFLYISKVAWKLFESKDMRYLPVEFGGDEGFLFSLFRNFAKGGMRLMNISYHKDKFSIEKYFNNMRFISIVALIGGGYLAFMFIALLIVVMIKGLP